MIKRCGLSPERSQSIGCKLDDSCIRSDSSVAPLMLDQCIVGRKLRPTSIQASSWRVDILDLRVSSSTVCRRNR
jgi:hypothetical protein